MRAVGIDLGTTNSLVAVVAEGRAQALPDDAGEFILPSVVAYTPEGVVVGEAARAAPVEQVIASVKRFIGRTAAEVEQQALRTTRVVQDGAVLRVLAGGKALSAVEVSAEILKALVVRASKLMQGQVERAVITVPAYFDDAQRQATRQAGRLAGLEVMRLLNEPTAAALAYGLDKRAEGRFAVFDLGGGTFDISILYLVDGVFEVLSTGGDTQLGGDDFDRAVAMYMLAEAGVAVKTAEAKTRRAATRAATAAKIALTEAESTTYTLGDFSRSLDRAEFDALVRPVLERVARPCRQALKDASLKAADLDGVVLVGGSTRSHVVRAFVAELFGQAPLGDIDPDQVVALGAAIQADLLSAESELRILGGADVLLLDVTPLSLGLETMGGVVEQVIHRNSQVPASRSQEFTTFKDGQTAMDIHVLQGERDLVADCRSLARFRLDGIPPVAAGMARVRVTFQVDADGLLQVSAEELSTGTQQSVKVEPSHGLSDEQVEEMLQASLDHAEADVFARLLRTAQVEAERVLMPIRKAMEQDGDLLTDEEGALIKGAIAELEHAAAGTDHRAIQDLVEMLDKVSTGFAQRRMERALKVGLAGRAVDEIEGSL